MAKVSKRFSRYKSNRSVSLHLLKSPSTILQNAFKSSFGYLKHGEGFRLSEVISPLVFQLGVGGIGGFIVGFAIKKLSKLILFLIGLFILALIYLSTQGIININYSALWDALSGLIGSAGSAFSWLVGVISLLPFAGSFIAGFLIGLKVG